MNHDHLNLIGSLYDAAIDLEKWGDVLDTLAPIVGAKSSALLMLETEERYQYSITASSRNITKEVHLEYTQDYSHYEADHFARVASSQSGIIFNEREFFNKKVEFDERPDVAYLKDKFNVLERFALKLNDDPSWFECITFQYQTDRGNITKIEEQVLRIFIPHIAKVAELTRVFSLLKSRYSAILGALNNVTIGMFITTSGGLVLAENTVASEISETSPDMSVSSSGVLKLSNREQHAAFLKMLQESSKTADANGDFHGSVMFIGNDINEDRILIEVSPLRDTDAELASQFRGALVAVYDPNQHRDLELTGVKELYSLTDSESQVLRLLIEGYSNDEIAESRNVGIQTVKSQLKFVFAKTNSRNRTHLVKRIMSYNLPLKK